MRRRWMIVLVVVWACFLCLAVRPGASQEQPAGPSENQSAPSDNTAPAVPPNDAVPAAPPVEAGAPGQAMEPLPPPSEDVMRPTRYGLRLTPGMLKLGTQSWMKDGPFANVKFDERQQAELGQKFSQRVMEAANRNGEAVRDYLETYVEGTLIDGNGRDMPADTKQRIGKQGADLVPAMRDLLKEFADDAGPLLTEKQREAFKKDLDRELENADRAEKKFKRWSEGGALPDEGLDDNDMAWDKRSGEGRDPNASPRMSGVLRDARRRADNDMRRMGVVAGKEFLMSAKAFFGFDAEQMAKGEQLLADYGSRLEPIMTPTWRQQVRENRIKSNLRKMLSREGMKPWSFHLENESNGLMAPLKALENAFCDKVIALARPEQRDAAIGALRERAAQHGMQFTDLDAEILRMLPE